MRNMIFITGGLGLALISALWALDSAVSVGRVRAEEITQLQARLARSEDEKNHFLRRLSALDEALGRLDDTLAANQAELNTKLGALDALQPEPTDEPKSFDCLDLRVPGQLDLWLR